MAMKLRTMMIKLNEMVMVTLILKVIVTIDI